MNVPIRMHAARTSLRGSAGRKHAAAAFVLAAGLLPVAPAQSQAGAPSPVTTRSAEVELSQAREYLREMQRIVAKMPRLIAEARRARDIIRLNCLRNKQGQLRRTYREGRQTFAALRVAPRSGAAAERNQQFTKLTVIYQRTTMLGQDAEACVGEDVSELGIQKLTVDVDDDIRDAEDGTARGVTPPLQTDRPFVASPDT
ncbi:MAG: hypothetical protein IPL40_06695 [Proteobacteria bacterium]|nr:hypothetical protein [Pseudomonadota bacterium]